MPFLLHGKTAKEDRDERKREKKAQLLEVCKTVDRRDQGRCRVCAKRCEIGSTFADRVERHHVIPRSLGGRDETGNLASLCVDCHEERHKKGTLRLSGNADERNELGYLCGLTVERLTEAGWKVVGQR
jgi:5-methylcytosine-specific restriction endonuclease McrA